MARRNPQDFRQYLRSQMKPLTLRRLANDPVFLEQPDSGSASLEQVLLDLARLREARDAAAKPQQRRRQIIGIAIAVVLLFTIGRFLPFNSAIIAILAVVGATYLILAAYGIEEEVAYAHAFKLRVLPRLLSQHGDVRMVHEYQPRLGSAIAAGALVSHTQLGVEDAFVGTRKGVPIEIAEVHLIGVPHRGKGSMASENRNIMMVRLKLPRSVAGKIVVIETRRLRGALLQADTPLPKVDLEDVVFAARYSVFSSDPVQARVLLTPAVKSRLLGMGGANFTAPGLFADDGELTFFFSAIGGRDLFEPAMGRDADMEQSVEQIDADLQQIFVLVDTIIDIARAAV